MPTGLSPTPSEVPIAITMGEPAGIGGEILLSAWRQRRAGNPVFFAIDDPGRLRKVNALAGIGTRVAAIDDPSEASGLIDRALPVLPLLREVPFLPGRPDPENAPAVLESIERAVSLTLEGRAAAVATNPIHKANLYAAGFAFPGHTEYLGHLSGVERVVMMLASSELRVVPVTIHIPLRRVPELLTGELIEETARIVEQALRQDFGIDRPRLVVAGLNPHAGEDGTLGEEDGRVIAPAIARLRERGLDVRGPLPADTMFHERAREGYDAALCMYHDQAMLPVKTLAFDCAVNLTLGLPFIRTSPDRGTALDIAGKGIARPESLIAAIAMAAELSRRRAVSRETHA
jgi:4-hydroxythreonine-4-phosphate dehydrogenase